MADRLQDDLAATSCESRAGKNALTYRTFRRDGIVGVRLIEFSRRDAGGQTSRVRYQSVPDGRFEQQGGVTVETFRVERLEDRGRGWTLTAINPNTTLFTVDFLDPRGMRTSHAAAHGARIQMASVGADPSSNSREMRWAVNVVNACGA